MTETSFSVYRLLRKHLLASARPAYLVLNKDLHIVSASGDLDYYELSNLPIGQSCESELNFLIGYDVNEALELRFYQINEEVIAHVVLLPHEGKVIVLFMDASEAYRQEIEVQQKTNDLLILSEKQDALVKELVKTRDSLAKKHEDLQEANASKATFIANISDEIKTPLTSMLGHASLLKNSIDESSEEMKMVTAIERSGRHLLGIMSNLISQMDIELDKVQINPAPVDINEFLQDIETLFTPIAKSKKLSFSIKIISLPPEQIKIDENRLRQVLINLLNNAFKYTTMGSVRLSIEWLGENLIFEVYDTGKGISETFQKEIFTAFKNSEGKRGKGLGLSIAKQFVELMGGNISCKSTLGVESRFSVVLPTEVIEAQGLSTTVIDEPDFGEEESVLIIEPNEDLSQLYEMALTRVGFIVSQAQSGEEGVKLINSKRPSIALVSMPYQDESIEVIKQIRDTDYNDPVLVLISEESQAFNRQVFEAGASGYIPKPFNIIDLIETIKAYVSPVQTVDMDITMRTYLRARFKEHLSSKLEYLEKIIIELVTNDFDFENCASLKKESQQILLATEMFGYTSISSAAELTVNAIDSRSEYSDDEFPEKLLASLKVFKLEISLLRET